MVMEKIVLNEERNMSQSSDNAATGLGSKMMLRSALQYGSVPETLVKILDEKLRQIPNR